jgi:anaerobic magnesium-protoporphyrin IX monomethyl ester cyclase
MHITLIHPPFSDVTGPYHSNAYLLGQLRQKGFSGADNRDLNIECADYLLEPQVIRSLSSEADRRLSELSRKPFLGFMQQQEYYGLVKAQIPEPTVIRSAARDLRDEKAFLDYDRYQASVGALEDYFGFLGALCYPARLPHFQFVAEGRFSPARLSDITDRDLAARACFLLERYFTERLAGDAGFENTSIFGISITYDHQLLPAVHLARLLKARWADKRVILGGTAISQLFKYLRDKNRMKLLFSVCDAVVIGEGETAICEIAELGANFQEQTSVSNTILYDARKDILRFPKTIHYEDLDAVACPAYEVPWHLYLSPARGVNYSPTRGCYWNRCAFCDYGLNADSPTAPWRERSIAKVIADLEVMRASGIGYVYFAVDSLMPAYLGRLSEALAGSDLNIRWSAEVRMEKSFSKARCEKLARSGCVAVSMGFESGAQRILNLMGKGTKTEQMSEAVKRFAEVGIAVQLMTITHFPTETHAERLLTQEFVQSHREDWACGDVAQFVLTGGSEIARNPSRFGIQLIECRDNEGTHGLQYRSVPEALQTDDASPTPSPEAGELFPRCLTRPWAGGIDTLHSLIYYGAHGRHFFKTHRLASGEGAAMQKPPDDIDLSPDTTIEVHGTLRALPFDIGRLARLQKLLEKELEDQSRVGKEPSYRVFLEWQKTAACLYAEPQCTYWLIGNGRRWKLDPSLFFLLGASTGSATRTREVLSKVAASDSPRVIGVLRHLVHQHAISFQTTSC